MRILLISFIVILICICRLSKHDHGVCVTFVIVCVICNVALSMENNDSRILAVPKSEFLKVMREIVFGSTGADVAVNGDGEEVEDENVFVINTNDYSDVDEEKKSSNKDSRFSFFSTTKKRTIDSPRSQATRDAQGNAFDSSSVSERGEKKVERITTITSRSIITGRNGPAELTQRKVPTNIKKGRVKSDSLYFLQKSLEERESLLKSGNANDGEGSARKPRYLYGKEDFFSSDTDNSITNRL